MDIKKNFTDDELEILWKKFDNVPINCNDEIEIDFIVNNDIFWLKGTDRFEIWEWFDNNHSDGVFALGDTFKL
jgi:hypothetical protein